MPLGFVVDVEVGFVEDFPPIFPPPCPLLVPAIFRPDVLLDDNDDDDDNAFLSFEADTVFSDFDFSSNSVCGGDKSSDITGASGSGDGGGGGLVSPSTTTWSLGLAYFVLAAPPISNVIVASASLRSE